MKALVPIVTSLVVAATTACAEEFIFQHENVLGTAMELRVHCEGEEKAKKIEQTVLREIDRLDKVLSRHRPDSELMEWQRSDTDRMLSPELVAVLARAEFWRAKTDGAFDVRSAQFESIWKNAQNTNSLPSTDQLVSVSRQLAAAPYSIGDGRVSRNDNLSLSLDALAKGFVMDTVCETVKKQHASIVDFVIEIGGDIRKIGKRSLNVSIADPNAHSDRSRTIGTIDARQPMAIATSGGYHRGFTVAGRDYSHIVDPRNGMPVKQIISASVIAESAMDADAAATAITVLGVADGLKLIESMEGFECIVQAEDGKIVASAGWPRHPSESAASDKNPADNSEIGLLVKFTLNRPKGKRYRRPYLAVWLDDADGFPVKTSLLWMQTKDPGPRWHRDLTRWYRNDRMRKVAEETEMIGVISSATRGPGEYEARFDGTDNAGIPLPSGEYTLCLEVAREHGTYQIVRKKITLGEGPIAETKIKGNVELSNISFQSVDAVIRAVKKTAKAESKSSTN